MFEGFPSWTCYGGLKPGDLLPWLIHSTTTRCDEMIPLSPTTFLWFIIELCHTPPPLLTQLHTPLLGKIQPPLRLSGTFRPFVFGSEEWDDRFCWSLLGHLGEDNLFSRGLAWKPVWSFSSPTQTKRRTKATYGWPRYHWCKYTTLRGSRWAPLKVNNGG